MQAAIGAILFWYAGAFTSRKPEKKTIQKSKILYLEEYLMAHTIGSRVEDFAKDIDIVTTMEKSKFFSLSYEFFEEERARLQYMNYQP